MIITAISALKPTITAMPWVERYGGVAIRLAKTETFDGREIRRYFPVSSDLTDAQCWQQGRYLDLVPNAKRRSILYWEVVTDTQDVNTPISGLYRSTQGARSVKVYYLRARARLVYWLNLKKLGLAPDNSQLDHTLSASEVVALSLINALEKGNFQIDGAGAVQLSEPVIKPKSPEIFDRYTYGSDVEKFMLYPYDYGAVEFTVNITVPKSCISDFVTGSELSC